MSAQLESHSIAPLAKYEPGTSSMLVVAVAVAAEPTAEAGLIQLNSSALETDQTHMNLIPMRKTIFQKNDLPFSSKEKSRKKTHVDSSVSQQPQQSQGMHLLALKAYENPELLAPWRKRNICYRSVTTLSPAAVPTPPPLPSVHLPISDLPPIVNCHSYSPNCPEGQDTQNLPVDNFNQNDIIYEDEKDITPGLL
ncbi:hypothetical protein HPG69_009688 [Diceros bicornis minor]|uniref:RNA polymerase II elongation factor ELL N-terminal domain-containing protein n=1 Tax=Diceros bicornis minor TaxID=77932 RepID=A0A7J7EXL2_DICBM|nr:hypothetical protein HPG69_009688 [Diceros bicornis minor]